MGAANHQILIIPCKARLSCTDNIPFSLPGYDSREKTDPSTH